MKSTNAETISDYVELGQKMTQEQFVTKFPDPFLVQVSVPREGDELTNPMFMTSRAPAKDIEVAARSCSPPTALVFRAMKRGKNAFASMITVGRTNSNDIDLVLRGVSKFHAYFSKDKKTGAYSLTDVNSTNGSFLNGDRLTPQEPHEVRDGDTVRFNGSMEFKLYSPSRFYVRLKAIAGQASA